MGLSNKIANLFEQTIEKEIQIEKKEEPNEEKMVILPCPPQRVFGAACVCIKCKRRETCGVESFCRKKGCDDYYVQKCTIYELENKENNEKEPNTKSHFIGG